MDSGATSRITRVLIAGPPGIGKTTICKKLAEMLERHGRKFAGFCTEEVRGQGGNRIGFDVVLVNEPGKRTPLARSAGLLNRSEYSRHRVGDYHVFLNNFEATALPALGTDCDVLFIDEIGKMELFSEKFQEIVQTMFFGPERKVRVIATIPQLHKVPQRYLPLFQKLQQDQKSRVINVTRQNRDTLPGEIFQLVGS